MHGLVVQRHIPKRYRDESDSEGFGVFVHLPFDVT
jgi:hypothetical protein